MSYTHTMRPFAVPKNALRSIVLQYGQLYSYTFRCCYNQCLQIPSGIVWWKVFICSYKRYTSHITHDTDDHSMANIDYVLPKVWSFIVSYFTHVQQQVAIMTSAKCMGKSVKLAEHRNQLQATKSIFLSRSGTLYESMYTIFFIMI